MRKIVSVFIGVLLLDVLEADGVDVDDLAVARDQRDDAAGLVAVDEPCMPRWSRSSRSVEMPTLSGVAGPGRGGAGRAVSCRAGVTCCASAA